MWNMHESFCLIEETEGRGRAAEIQTIQSATTLGDVRALIPKLRYVSLPFDFEDQHEDETDDALWHWQEEPAAEDGDWPEMPTAYALRAFEDMSIFDDLVSATGAEIVTTVFSGDYLKIPLDREQDLLAVLARHGIAATRDDAVIYALAGSQDV
ncbi:MAG: hypothetical protein H0T40_08205 [Geodermatophilaceae bacterium]|nr:hypothetical protein [Geodermatophilaceae bacterium]